MPPVMVPTDHVKLLGKLEVRFIFGLSPLQIVVDGAFVTTMAGFTLIVMEYGAPAQVPYIETGVTKYSTNPERVELGFVST